MPIDFVDLHQHSTFSHGDAYGLPSQIVERAKQIGRKALAITDHGSISSFVQLNKECSKVGIKPIFGYEAYIVDGIEEMYASKARHKNHITILAKNEQGYRNVLKLASAAYLEGFYYRPTIDAKMLFNHSDGLIVFSGCWTGKMQALLREKDSDGAIALAKQYKDVFGGRYYLETQHYDLFQSSYQPLMKLSKIVGIPVVLTCDVHYLTAEQDKIQEMLHAARDIRGYSAESIVPYSYQWESEALLQRMASQFPEARWQPIMERTAAIADSINVSMPMGGAPRFGVPDAAALLRQKAFEGLKKRGCDTSAYRERLEHELAIVQQKDFSDYFLITQDIVIWAKEHEILVGPGRGSSGGSLLCYVLYINEIDPLLHNLMFERFIDIDRYDYPDIDLDFEKHHRGLVKQHVSDKYGEDKVTNIATFATFKGKNSLDAVGKMFSIPASEVATVKKYLVERSEADMRNQLTIEDTFEMSEEAKEVSQRHPDLMKAKWLEGQYKNFGRHAAGIVISTIPLDEIMAVYTSTSGDRLASFEMNDLESLKLLKFDLLGLAELGVVHDAAKLAGMPFQDIFKIKHTDEKTVEGFRKLDIVGIFQYDGDSTKSILRQMTHIDFKELADCIALSKPGPAHSGASTLYLDAMRGNEAIGFLWHPTLKAITQDTYGQILYQEQLMRVLREVGSMSWTDTGIIRKVISKSKGEQAFEAYWTKFKEGAVNNGFSGEDAEKLWNAMKVFGRYAFNKSHSTAYAMLGFWSMYMKQHHPLAFYTAKLVHEENEETKRRILKEMSQRGYRIHPPKLGRSGATWKMELDGVRGGFLEVNGIGEKAAATLAALSQEEVANFRNSKIKGINKRMIQALQDCHALDDSEEDDFYGMNIFDCLDGIAPGRTKTIDIDDGGKGYAITIAGIFREMNYKDIHEERRSRGQNPVTKDPEIAKYAMMMLEDDTDRVLVMIDRYAFHKWGKQVWDAYHAGSYVVIKGKKTPKWRIVRAKDFAFYTPQQIVDLNVGFVVEVTGIPTEKDANGQKYIMVPVACDDMSWKMAIVASKYFACDLGQKVKVLGKKIAEKHGIMAYNIEKAEEGAK